jgi:hypothetical protein
VVDFRYHALSLVAVFLALGIGIVLGVTVGDSLVSEADQNLRDSLRDDVTDARQEANDQQELGVKREEVINQAAAVVADGRLRGVRVALIAIGELPDDVSDSVEEAVESAGGELARPGVYDSPDFGPSGPGARRPARHRLLGRELGRRIERGYRGGPVSAVVVYRHPPAEPEDEEGARDLELREAFEEGLFRGLRRNVVGVETMGTDPSQVGWYEDQVVPSVDNVDLTAGRLALVLVLEETVLTGVTGEPPEGAYGYKDTADRALPDLQESAEGASP